jgi:hypothetical protein
VAGYGVHGLYRVDRVTGQTRRFGYEPKNPTSLNSDALFCLFADPLDPNLLWLGTFGSGLGRFDKRTGRVRRFTIADGLSNNVVYSAIPDRSGSIWIGTNKGIGRLDRRTFQVQNYTTQDGILADEFNRFHFLQLPDERIIMGGWKELRLFIPTRSKMISYQPAVELTGIQINNRTIKPGTDSPMGDRSEQALQSLRLPYDQNFLNLEFARCNSTNLKKTGIGTGLEGLDDPDWIISKRPVAVIRVCNPVITGFWSMLPIRPGSGAAWFVSSTLQFCHRGGIPGGLMSSTV